MSHSYVAMKHCPSMHSVFESSVRASFKVSLIFVLSCPRFWKPVFDNLCPVAPEPLFGFFDVMLHTCPAQLNWSVTNRFWQCCGWSNHSWCRGSIPQLPLPLPPPLAPVPNWFQGLLDMNWLICELSSLVRLAWQPCNTIAGHNGCGYCLDMKVTIFLIDITASFCIIQSLLVSLDFSPHLCVGFLFLVVYSCLPPSARRPPTCPHKLSTHNLLTHNLHTQNLSPHNLLTHNLSTHTNCPHTTYSHTQLDHTQFSHTQLAHTHTQLVTTQLAHTHNLSTHNLSPQVRGRRGTWWHPPSLCVAGVALGDTQLLTTWTPVGTYIFFKS